MVLSCNMSFIYTARCAASKLYLRYFPVLSLARCNATTNCDRTFKFSELQIQYTTPSESKPKPDPSKTPFGTVFSDHMFEVEWTVSGGWDTPRIVPLHEFTLHPSAKVFHYAQAVFEGMKAYKHANNKVTLFRPELNMARMLATAERAALPTFDDVELLKCLKKLVDVDKDWVPLKDHSSLYIRPTFIATEYSLGVQPANRALLYIITCPVGPYFISGIKPIALLADPSYVRACPGGVGDKKMASNYAPSLYVQRLAQSQGLQQVLWLRGRDHQINEAGAMNVFFFLKKGNSEFELVTPALDGTILPGVVRQSLLDLTKEWGEFDVCERSITMKEIVAAVKEKRLLEMFVCGTAVCVCPVSSVKFLNEDINIPTMEQHNPLYMRLLTALRDIQYGKIQSKWSVPVD